MVDIPRVRSRFSPGLLLLTCLLTGSGGYLLGQATHVWCGYYVEEGPLEGVAVILVVLGLALPRAGGCFGGGLMWVYRHGPTSYDVRRTLKEGVPNSPMKPIPLSDRELWDLTDYVCSLQCLAPLYKTPAPKAEGSWGSRGG